MTELMIGWTTAPDESTAKSLAENLLSSELVACVQVLGPITSYYIWEGKQVVTQEFRLTLKFLKSNTDAVERWIQENHPYDLPQWVAIDATTTSLEYLSWVQTVAPEKVIK